MLLSEETGSTTVPGGLWLDWQAQGTRVTQNIFYKNTPPDGTEFTEHLSVAEDIFVEVSHGPTLMDNNIFYQRLRDGFVHRALH